MSTDNNAISTYSNNKTLALLIFPQIDNVRDLCKVSEVCKRWKGFAYDNSLWKPFVDRFFRQRTQPFLDSSSFFGKFFNHIPEKEKFKQLYLQQTKWRSELKYHSFKVLDDDDDDNYDIRCYGEYLVVLKSFEDFYRVFKENGTEIKTLPGEVFSFIQVFRNQESVLHNAEGQNFVFSKKSIGGYIFEFRTDTIEVWDQKLQNIQLKHEDIDSDADGYIAIDSCIALIPDSTLLVSSATKHDYEGYPIYKVIFIWDLATGNCIQKICGTNFSTGNTFFCFRDECLFIGCAQGILIINLRGEIIQTLSFPRKNATCEVCVCSVNVTDEGIFALDAEGFVHIWSKKEKATEEKVDTISSNHGFKKRKNPDSLEHSSGKMQ